MKKKLGISGYIDNSFFLFNISGDTGVQLEGLSDSDLEALFMYKNMSLSEFSRFSHGLANYNLN